MGDTGSLFLGGLLSAIAVYMKNPFILLIVGFVYVAEALSVIIMPEVDRTIREYLSLRGPADKTEPLFIAIGNRNHNGRISTRTLRGIVKDNLRKCGLDSDRLTAHSLRHTAANIALANGTPIREVQQLLRHSNVNTTMIYIDELDRAKNTSEANIAKAIFY